MKIELIEVMLVCIILAIQAYVFYKTLIKIRIFANVFPVQSHLRISKYLIPLNNLENQSTEETLKNISSYRIETNLQGISDNDIEDIVTFYEDIEQESGLEMCEVRLIEFKTDEKKPLNPVFESIIISSNKYLIRNRSASSDFNLIKDIVERNTDAIEDEINHSVGIPLYLGLAGTMLGIIIGLFNMPDLGAVLDTTEKDLLLNKGIELLIGGVKIAMIASAAGLILTIINSGWKYKEAKRKVERDKNDFYTFLQIELLPSINNGIASTLDSLQRNLVLFKNDFTQQLNTLAITVGKMNGVFVQGNIALEKQKAILDSIDKSKVSEMTKYNVKVLQQLDVSVTQFQNFNAYLTNVNQFVENSQLILESTRMVLERTNKFEVIADSIQNRLDQSALLLDFLSAHFKNLEEQKQFAANAVADVGFAISDTFKDLKEHIQNSTEAVKRFTVDEIDALKNALSASKTNLSNLEHLATLKTDLSLFKNSSASQGERLKNVLEEINTNMTISKEILEHIEKTSISYRLKIIFSRVKKMFKAK